MLPPSTAPLDRSRIHIATLGALAGALAAWPVAIAAIRHDGTPVGADTPVYVWWARMVQASGVSTLSFRPGVPAAISIVATTLHLPIDVVVAALGCALVAMAGLGGYAALRAGGHDHATASLGMVLTGVFATYLASGHLSNATFAALFLPCIACTLVGSWAGRTCGAVLLGAAGLAHPEFSVIAVLIVIGAIALASFERLRTEAIGWACTAVGGVVVTGVGLAIARIGGPAFDVPTSLDVFLAQTGQTATLRTLFLGRFVPKIEGYALWAWVPLAALAIGRLRTGLGRVLVSWAATGLLCIGIGLVWQPFPPHRVVAFAFCLPLLAAIGVAVVRQRAPRIGSGLAAASVVAVVIAATLSWAGARRPFDDPTAGDAARAGAALAAAPSGTVVVDLPPTTRSSAIVVIRAANLIRAAMPADRVRDLVVRFREPNGMRPETTSFWQASEGAATQAAGSGPTAEVRLDAVSGPPSLPGATQLTAPTAAAFRTPSAADVALGAAGWLVVCWLTGAGWCATAGCRGVDLATLPVAIGLALLIVVAECVDALGTGLGSGWVSFATVGTIGLAGVVAAWATSRRPARGADEPRATTGEHTHAYPAARDASGAG
jgi:hypothetical protein